MWHAFCIGVVSKFQEKVGVLSGEHTIQVVVAGLVKATILMFAT